MVSLVQAGAIVAFAYTLAHVVTTVINGFDALELSRALAYFAGAAGLRGLSMIALDGLAVRAGAHSKRQLRQALMGAIGTRGPRWLEGMSTPRLTTIMGPGLDALDKYFGKYLPQLILSAVVTPFVVIVLYTQDFLSGLAVTVTLPLIPVFMALVGWATQAVQKAQWEALQGLAQGFLDTIEGLATLKIFGRQARQRERILTMTEEYRVRTMKVLRVSFLSAFVLELAASLSVAIVAVSIGLRLIEGNISLSLGLFVLILVPEVFLPLRAVGAQYHAAAEGLEVAEDVFEILEIPGPSRPGSTTPERRVPELPPAQLTLTNFQALRNGLAVHEPITATIHTGELVAIVGDSGAGKSSVVEALLGFCDYQGTIRLDDIDIRPEALRDVVAWTPQTPMLGFGTIAENISLGAVTVDRNIATQALELAGVGELDLDRDLGVDGAGLSGGQAHRVALARAIYRVLTRHTPFLLLDEVTASLDEETESQVMAAIAQIVDQGCAVVVVSHRTAVMSQADRRISLRALVPHSLPRRDTP